MTDEWPTDSQCYKNLAVRIVCRAKADLNRHNNYTVRYSAAKFLSQWHEGFRFWVHEILELDHLEFLQRLIERLGGITIFMTNLEIEEIRGVKKAFPKTYMGKATGGYNVAIMYDNYLLEVRVSMGGDPRTGLVVVHRYVEDAKEHDIADQRMIEIVERAGVTFKGRNRVIPVRG